MKQRGFVATIFVIGCATGGVASQLVIPPARAGTNPTRWEYHCGGGYDRPAEQLNKAGAEGWELVTMFPTHQDHELGGNLSADRFGYCFKRALP